MRDEVTELRRRIEALETETKAEIQRAREADDRLAALPEPVDTEAIADKMRDLEETNRKVRENVKRAEAQAEAAKAEARYAELDGQVSDVVAARKTALAGAGLDRVAGLEFVEDGVHLNGVPWPAASTGQRIAAAIALRCVSDPPLRVAWTQEGDKLDDAALAEVRRLCADADLQLLMERTGERDAGDDQVLLIADGALVGAEASADA